MCQQGVNRVNFRGFIFIGFEHGSRAAAEPYVGITSGWTEAFA